MEEDQPHYFSEDLSCDITVVGELNYLWVFNDCDGGFLDHVNSLESGSRIPRNLQERFNTERSEGGFVRYDWWHIC